MAVLISIATYYHTSVMRQVSLSGSLFPPAVIGFIVVIVLAWNPWARRASLRPAELAVITALVLAACYWPGSVFNNLTNKLALPAYWNRVEPAWKSAEVMSYVPGGSARLAEGHVRDWGALADGLADLDEEHPLFPVLSDQSREAVEEYGQRGTIGAVDRDRILADLNQWIDPAGSVSEGRQQRRAELVRWFPMSVLPPPDGGPLLPAGGQGLPEVTDKYIVGGTDLLGSEVPWSHWLPVIGLWVGLGMLLAGAAIGLTIIVHPQWAKRELLAYPVVSFIKEMTQPNPGGRWPPIVSTRTFWLGFGVVFALRLVNGLHAWFPDIVFESIPLRLDFSPLKELFPTAAKVPGSQLVFAPIFDPVLIAFAVLLSRSVSLSLGLGGLIWLAWGAFLLSRGVHPGSDLFGEGPTNLMLFGAYSGAAVMVLYVGRRHYLAVSRATLGLPTDNIPPLWAWAGRLVLVCSVAAVVMLATLGGMDWPFAVMTVVMTGVIYLMVARIHVETGAIFIHTFWFSSSILPALLGDKAVGPTNLVVMFLFTLVLIEGTQSAIMPMLADGWRLCDDVARRATRGMAGWLGVAIALSAGAAAVAVLIMGYHFGAPRTGGSWGYRRQPSAPFDRLSSMTADLAATDNLSQATDASGLERLMMIQWQAGNLGWVVLGAGLVLACAILRLRVSWWPIHPVLFLVLGTYYGYRYAPSFLLGWVLKTSVVYLAGLRGYGVLKAMMMGVICGEMITIFGWMVVNAIYYFTTGIIPPDVMS